VAPFCPFCLFTLSANDLERDADAAGPCGRRLFVEIRSNRSIHLGDSVADRVADRIVVFEKSAESLSQEEVLRALRPQGVAYAGKPAITKSVPDGIDDPSHPYHSPDTDQPCSLCLGRIPHESIN